MKRNVPWFDLEFPTVVAVRRQPGQMCSILDFDCDMAVYWVKGKIAAVHISLRQQPMDQRIELVVSNVKSDAVAVAAAVLAASGSDADDGRRHIVHGAVVGWVHSA